MAHSIKGTAGGPFRRPSEIDPYRNRVGTPRRRGNSNKWARWSDPIRGTIHGAEGDVMGEKAGGTWWGRGAGDSPGGEGAGASARGERGRGRGLTGPLALAISGVVLYLAGDRKST